MIKKKPQNKTPLNLVYNLLGIIIGIIITLVIVQKCNDKGYDSPIITRDTTWIYKDSTVYSKPQIIKTIPIEVQHITKEYLPDTNYSKLVIQYQELVQKFLAKNIEGDSVKIDSIGYVYIQDTVSHNVISGRSTSYNLKYPIIKETIFIPEKPINQVYLGGILQAGGPSLSNLSAGVLLKSKKDHIYGVSAGVNINGNIQYGVQSYWKISLKRKP